MSEYNCCVDRSTSQTSISESQIFTETLKNLVSCHTEEYSQGKTQFYSHGNPVLQVMSGFPRL